MATPPRVTLADFREMQARLLQTRQELEDCRERERAALEELRLRPVLQAASSFPPPPREAAALANATGGSGTNYPTELNPFGPSAPAAEPSAGAPPTSSSSTQTEPSSALEVELHDDLRRTRDTLRSTREELQGVRAELDDARESSAELTRRFNAARSEEMALENRLVLLSLSSEEAVRAEQVARRVALAAALAAQEEKDAQIVGLKRATEAAEEALRAEESARRAALAAADAEVTQLRERLEAAEAAADLYRTTPSTPSKLEVAGTVGDSVDGGDSGDSGHHAGAENTATTLVPTPTPATAAACASGAPPVAAAAEVRRDAARRALELRRRCTLRLVLHAWCGANRNSKILRNMTLAMRNMSLVAASPSQEAAPPPAAAAAAARPAVEVEAVATQTAPSQSSALEVLQVLHSDASTERTSQGQETADGPAAGLGELYERLAAARAAQGRAEEASARAGADARARGDADAAVLGAELATLEQTLLCTREALREERERGGEAMQDVAAALAAAHSMTLHAIEASGARCERLETSITD